MHRRYIGNHAPRVGNDAMFTEGHLIQPGWSQAAKETLRNRSWRRSDAILKGQGRMVRHTTQIGPLRYTSIYYKRFPLWKRLRNRFFPRYRPQDAIAERLKVYANREEPRPVEVKKSNSHFLR